MNQSSTRSSALIDLILVILFYCLGTASVALLLCRCKRFHTENLLFKVESMPNKTPVKNEPPLLLDARPALCIIRAVLHKRIISFSIYKYNPGFIYRFLCTIPEI